MHIEVKGRKCSIMLDTQIMNTTHKVLLYVKDICYYFYNVLMQCKSEQDLGIKAFP